MQLADLKSLDLAVEVPFPPPVSLQEAEEEESWQKKKKIQSLKLEYNKKIQELEKMRCEAQSQADSHLEDVYRMHFCDDSGNPKLVSPDFLPEIADVLMQAYVESLLVNIMQDILRQDTDLEFRVEHLELLSVGLPPREAQSTSASSGDSRKMNEQDRT